MGLLHRLVGLPSAAAWLCACTCCVVKVWPACEGKGLLWLRRPDCGIINTTMACLQEAPPQESGDFDTGDEADEVAQYEAWRERELHRIARDRCGQGPAVLRRGGSSLSDVFLVTC